ncbi:hypothetical protein [Meiothermus sp.]|uniref:hypothetical protein n=1 Tax=Meiothermus sp. TaxID=1955249 RepID=UPI0021DE78CA|nr:hypothetical protein [Meiothermus sp.]GIW32867.1 MAG: hypothetical protein KatS3mg072_0200 [Meiothermus sp.]
MPIDLDRVSTILAEAAFSDDRSVCQRHGITDRTLRRYRARMMNDPRLSAIVREKQARLTEKWADELAPAIGAAIRFLRQACELGDPTSPNMVRAVAESLQALAELDLTRQVLQSRMGGDTWGYSKN